ncbi:MAG: hypothetical protein HEEMFOPI_00510 [Holosporales bacterium]
MKENVNALGDSARRSFELLARRLDYKIQEDRFNTSFAPEADEIKKLQEGVDWLLGKENILTNEMGALRADVNNLKEENKSISSLLKEVDALRADVNFLKEESRKDREARSELEERCHALENKNRELQNALGENNKRFGRDLGTLKVRISQLEGEIKKMQKFYPHMKKKYLH